jgi:serine/threonine protein kinase
MNRQPNDTPASGEDPNSVQGTQAQACQKLDELLAHINAQATPRPALPTPHAPSLLGPATLPHVPGYELVAELGRGGMGVVYLARDPKLKRHVALKMILANAPLTANQRARFQAEAEAVARLQHPHIVQIFAVGEHEGQPYVALEYLPGGSLDRQIQGTPQPPREAARLVELLARAVHAAHQIHIIHRDLKPGNVLLAPANPGDPGWTPYGLPKVADFGLARQFDPSQPRPRDEVVAGTPDYMPPEQAAGQIQRVGPATDVYALGVILYEMLTGRRPFQGGSNRVTLEKVRNQPPTPPRDIQPDVPAELEAICLRCLAKQPAGRYPSAAALADALLHYHAHSADPPAAQPNAKPVPAVSVRPGHTEETRTDPVRGGRREGRPWVPWSKVGVVLMTGLVLAVGLVVWPGLMITGRLSRDTAEPFKGDIDVELWEKGNPNRQGVRLHQEGALPARVGDVVFIKAKVNRPAYLYVVWIDAEGKAAPIYPWEEGDWAKRPQTEQKRTRLVIPEDPEYTGTLPPGTTGMDTLLLLVRETPLSAADNDKLRVWVGDLGAQKEPALRAAAWFENGELVRDDPDRSAPVFAKRKANDDPVLRTQALLRTRLAEVFPYTRAVCFAFDGRGK